MSRILIGKKIREGVYENLKKRINALGFQPVLVDVVVGSHPVSLQYVYVKKRVAESLGIDFRIVSLDENSSTKDIKQAISLAVSDVNCCGCIVQLPLPNHVDTLDILATIPRGLDVDCLHPESESLFYKNEALLMYPTVRSIMSFIQYLDISKGANIVIIGQGKLVGRPIFHILQKEGYLVTALNKETLNKESIILNADVVISATGASESVRGDNIKEGCIVIDAGTSEMAGSIVGDVHRLSIEGVAGVLVPVPGGVGPLTTLMLCDNVIQVAEKKYELR